MAQINKNLSQMNIWKSNLLKLKEEKGMREAALQKELSELYERLVDEAVLFITDSFNHSTKLEKTLEDEKNGIVMLSLQMAFLIPPCFILNSKYSLSYILIITHFF